MSAISVPLDLDSLSYTGDTLRQAALLEVMAAGGVNTGRSGVRPGDTGMTVTLSGSNINVSAGTAAVYWPTRGVYRVGIPSPGTPSPSTLTAAHATLPRVDLVYLRVFDNAFDSSGQTTGNVIYLAGTAAASPVAPTPSGTQIYMPLATISVPPVGGGSPSVSTAIRPYTVAPGGILPAAAAPASPYVGMAWHDGTDLKIWNGSSWDTYAKVTSVPWIDIAPASGFTSPQGTLKKAQYRLVTALGTPRVELRGSFNCTSDVVAQVTFFTMPVGYRPAELRTLPATRGFNSTSSGITRIEIATTGAMSVFGASSPAQTSWFCLDGQFYDLS